MKINLQFTERNISLSGEVDDLTPLFFMSFLFNKSEKELYAEGKYRAAATALIKRRELALESLSETEHDEEILAEFFYKYNHTEARQEIINRLLEIFDFPEEMIKIKSDGRFKICLHSRELAEIVFGIIGSLKTPKTEESEEVGSEEAEQKKSWKPLEEVKSIDELAKRMGAEEKAKQLANKTAPPTYKFGEKDPGVYSNDEEIRLKVDKVDQLISAKSIRKDGSVVEFDLKLPDNLVRTPAQEEENQKLLKLQEKSPEALELEILEAERMIEALKVNKLKLETLKQNI